MHYDSKKIEDLFESSVKKLFDMGCPYAKHASIAHSSVYTRLLHLRDRESAFIAEFRIDDDGEDIHLNRVSAKVQAHASWAENYSRKAATRTKKRATKKRKASPPEVAEYHAATELFFKGKDQEALTALDLIARSSSPLAVEATFKRAQVNARLGDYSSAAADYISSTGATDQEVVDAFIKANNPRYNHKSSPQDSGIASKDGPEEADLTKTIRELRERLNTAIKERYEANESAASFQKQYKNLYKLNQDLRSRQAGAEQERKISKDALRELQRVKSELDQSMAESRKLSAVVERVKEERDHARSELSKSQKRLDEALALQDALKISRRIAEVSLRKTESIARRLYPRFRGALFFFAVKTSKYSPTRTGFSRILLYALHRVPTSRAMAMSIGASFALGYLVVSIPLTAILNGAFGAKGVPRAFAYQSTALYKLADLVSGGALTRDRIKKARSVMRNKYPGL